MIKNLIFDFGKVLVDYDFEAFFRKYIPDTERCKAFTPILYNEDIQKLLDREATPFNEIMEKIIEQHPSFEKEIRMFNDYYTEIVTEEIECAEDTSLGLASPGHETAVCCSLRDCRASAGSLVGSQGLGGPGAGAC